MRRFRRRGELNFRRRTIPRWRRVANLLMGLGLLGLATGLVLLYLSAPNLFPGVSETADTEITKTAMADSSTVPTPSLQGTPGVTQTPPALSEPTPKTQPVTPTSQPPVDRSFDDLLLIQNNNLVRWNPQSQTGIILAQRVSAFAASADGERVALLRSRPGNSADSEKFDLAWLDLPNRRLVERLDAISRVYHMAISPDGSRIAYFDTSAGGSVFVMDLDGGAPPYTQGYCLAEKQGDCLELAWSIDNEELIWSDSRGVWLAAVGNPQPAVVVAPNLDITDPRGQKSTLLVAFRNFRWSPLGRYLLADIHPLDAPVRWMAVLDTRSGRVVEAPGTFGAQELAGSAVWEAATGQLITVSSENPPAIRFYVVQATRNDLLLQVEEILLPASVLPDSAGLHAVSLAQTNTNEFSFGLAEAIPQAGLHLMRFDHKSYDFAQVSTLTEVAPGLVWAPSGAGALFPSPNGGSDVLSLNGEESGKMVGVPGEASSAAWLPDPIFIP